jgi:hypothetical protein
MSALPVREQVGYKCGPRADPSRLRPLPGLRVVRFALDDVRWTAFDKAGQSWSELQNERCTVGAWRSLVARLVWGEEVAGSIPVAPTITPGSRIYSDSSSDPSAITAGTQRSLVDKRSSAHSRSTNP